MLVARTKWLPGLICVGLVAALARPVWACDGCKKTGAAEQSASLAAVESSAPTFVLTGVSKENVWSVKEAVAKLGGAITLDATTARISIPQDNGKDLLLSKVEQALEGTGASIDENRWTLAGPVRLHVAGMTCGGCAAKIKGALSKLDGVNDVTVDLRSKEEGYVRLASSIPVTYGAVRKAVAGTPFRLIDVSLANASGCCGGGGCGCACCGTKAKVVASAGTKTDGKGCCGGSGCGCACCSKSQGKTKVASKNK